MLPLFEHLIPTIADARRRFLAPGGTLIPRSERIWAAVVEAPERYGKIVDPWEHNSLDRTWSPARRIVVNDLQKARFTPGAVTDQTAGAGPRSIIRAWRIPTFAANCHWTIQREGTGHGIAVWFETDLADGVGFSNAPGEPEAIYGSMFFPWLNPVPLAMGQTVRVDLQAKLLEGDYFWRWITRIESAGRPGEIATQFDQSQLKGAVLSPENLRRRASTHVPQLSKAGLLRRRTLDLMDGTASLEEISKRLTAEFPDRFSRWQQALSFAGEVSKENSS